jgi:DNA transposition AAA+ family ATPase
VTEGERAGAFIATKEHRRFAEFADAVREHRYIGLRFGDAGVGKTVSARRYARRDVAEPLLAGWGPRHPSDTKVEAAVAGRRTVFHTPAVCCPFRELRENIARLVTRAGVRIDEHPRREERSRTGGDPDLTELLIVDEAERLTTTALEHLRDVFDRTGIGLILIGMPGLEKRLSRYPQPYSRVGFTRHYRPLQGDELTFVLTRHWRQLGLALEEADFTDAQAMASIARITGGNFRLLHRLSVQIGRILEINSLSMITDDVEAARSTLVIGAT